MGRPRSSVIKFMAQCYYGIMNVSYFKLMKIRATYYELIDNEDWWSYFNSCLTTDQLEG